jgi:colicin import membrane protein
MSSRRAPWFAIALALACGELLSACGEPKKSGPTAEEAQAAAKKADDEAKEAAAVAERKAKREADEKAKAAADEKVKAELERLSAALPAKLPKDPVAACEAVGQAQDAYVRRLGDKDAIAAWDAGGKDKALPMAIVQCTQADSVKTAACQKNMFDNAGPELKDSSKAIMQVCIDKYGSTRKPPAGMPQKRPG